MRRIFSLPNDGDVIQNGEVTYAVGSYIREGAFGLVYNCADAWGNELVLKIPKPLKQSYEEVRDRWLEEMQKLLNFRHPNITYIYDAFEYNHTFYLVIEKCDSTIEDIIADPGIDRNILVKPLARCVLQALQYMHNEGWVHKDLHAGNVYTSMIKDEISPDAYQAMVFKVGDLGISRLETDINIFNTILAQWMLPPEHLKPAEFGTLGTGTDIYHFGLLLLSLLYGSTLDFTAEQIVQGVPRQLAENLNSPYSGAIAKALRRHVQYSTQTPMEFWVDLNP